MWVVGAWYVGFVWEFVGAGWWVVRGDGVVGIVSDGVCKRRWWVLT